MTQNKFTNTYSQMWLRNHQRKLRQAIRNASQPDTPNLINEWLQLEQELLCLSGSYFTVYANQCRLLLETVCDEFLPSHWRCCCLDALNKPLLNMKAYARTANEIQHYNALANEIRTMTHYLSAGLSHQASTFNGQSTGARPHDNDTY